MYGLQPGGCPKRLLLWWACRKPRGRSRLAMTRTWSSLIPASGRSFAPRPCGRASVTGHWTAWTSASLYARSTCGVQRSGETDGESEGLPAAWSGRLGSGRRSPEDRILGELALEAGCGAVAGVEGR